MKQGKINILVIKKDVPGIYEVIRIALKEKFEITFASSVDEAIQITTEKEIHCFDFIAIAGKLDKFKLETLVLVRAFLLEGYPQHKMIAISDDKDSNKQLVEAGCHLSCKGDNFVEYIRIITREGTLVS